MSRSLLDLLLGQPGDARRALAEMQRRRLSFDPALRDTYTTENGWRADDVRRALPPEPPGDPVPDGSWETACRHARDYDFADPSIVRGVFDRDEPLENRTMLLILRFYALRIQVGVRVGDVYNERRELDGHSGRVFGWNYRTLEGHVEQGQMDWQVWKFPRTGEVLFRICAVSRAARGGNPLLRLGFRLFGRREQLRFLELTAERMGRLTAEHVSLHRAPHPCRGRYAPNGVGTDSYGRRGQTTDAARLRHSRELQSDSRRGTVRREGRTHE